MPSERSVYGVGPVRWPAHSRGSLGWSAATACWRGRARTCNPARRGRRQGKSGLCCPPGGPPTRPDRGIHPGPTDRDEPRSRGGVRPFPVLGASPARDGRPAVWWTAPQLGSTGKTSTVDSFVTAWEARTSRSSRGVDRGSAGRVIADLDAESDELDGLVAGPAAGGWATPTPAEGWTIAHQIAHLPGPIRPHSSPPPIRTCSPRSSSRRWRTRPASSTTAPPKVCRAATARAARLLAERPVPTWPTALLAVPAGQAARLVRAADERHLDGDRPADGDLGARPGRRRRPRRTTREPTARLRHVAHLAVRTRDFAYLLNDLQPPGRAVPGGADRARTARAGPGDRRTRRSGSTGPALDFCLLATQRRHRDDTDVRAVGPDADSVARHHPGLRRSARARAGPGAVRMTAPLRIGNASGFYGDRLRRRRGDADGGPLDVLTGDYLAELTMLILGRDRLKDPSLGYAKTFLRQLETGLGAGARPGRHDRHQRRRAQPGRPRRALSGTSPTGSGCTRDRLRRGRRPARAERDGARPRHAADRERLPRRLGDRGGPAGRRRRRRHRPGHRRVAWSSDRPPRTSAGSATTSTPWPGPSSPGT